jgi:CheY-like chemotaxis protein
LAPPKLRGLRALVVDDNATNRRLLHDILSKWGMRPTVVESGPAGLASMNTAVAAGDPYVLVLLDAMMPEMDGFTVARHIQMEPALVRPIVMMLSSAGRREDAALCRELGLANYLTKPITQAELFEAIATALRLSRERQALPPAAASAPTSNGTCWRILLAEDNLVNQKLAIRLLEKQGHQIVVANNGKEAVASVAQQSFDAVLMDLQMPELGGIEATRLIRQGENGHGQRLPIIAMTAHALKGDRERCLEAGMDGYVSKPVQADELFRELERVLYAYAVSNTAKPEEEPREEEFIRAHAVERLAGDEELLQELFDIFQEECPRMLTEVREAVEAGDGASLRRAAHTLKGAVGNFGTGAAFKAAARLEGMGSSGDLTGASAVYTDLDLAIRRLCASFGDCGRTNPCPEGVN